MQDGARQDALIKELYVNHRSNIVMLDDVLNRPGQKVEIEDILGEALIVSGVERVLKQSFHLQDRERSVGGLPSQIKAAAKRQEIELPVGWKASVALDLVSTWAEEGTTLADEVLDTAAMLFSVLNERFESVNSSG